VPFRSLLFTPATRLDRLPKALASGADWVALDLEDGVGPGEKSAARDKLTAFVADGLVEVAGRVAVRINALNQPEGIRDLAAMLDWPVWPGMIILPKVEAASQVAQIAALAAGRARNLLLTLETAAGIARADEIARAATEGAVLGYGSADHMAEVGGTMSAPSLAHGRAVVLNAAAVAGIPAMDGVWLDFKDVDGLRDEANLVKSMGFAGKIAIHPDQIDPINKVFSPSEDEVATARALLAASDKAGGGAFSFKGKMVDAPVLARARRIMVMNGSER
jgi:citrate lyase beta subunit